MINLITKLPNKIYIAFSGGVDSVAATHFLSNGKKDVCLLFFDHGTTNSSRAREFVQEFSNSRSIDCKIGQIVDQRSRKQSLEDYWREQRYKFLDTFTDRPVVTCHHLDDAVETWVMSSLSGQSKLIPVKRDNYVRPFLTTRKSQLIDWANSHRLQWCEDDSNTNTSFTRNYVRHEMMQHILHVSPGIHKIIKKKYMEKNAE